LEEKKEKRASGGMLIGIRKKKGSRIKIEKEGMSGKSEKKRGHRDGG